MSMFDSLVVVSCTDLLYQVRELSLQYINLCRARD